MSTTQVKYFKAVFSGVFQVKEYQSLPFYQFNTIEWHQLKITSIEAVDAYDAWELNTANAWYRKKLKPYKNKLFSKQIIWKWPSVITTRDFPWIEAIQLDFPQLVNRPHLIIPLDETHQLQETLHEVVMKRIELDTSGSVWFGDYREAKGIIWFQLKPEPIRGSQSQTTNQHEAEVSNKNDDATIDHEPTGSSQNGTTPIWSVNEALNTSISELSDSQQPRTMSSKGNRRWFWFILIWILLCLWKFPSLLVPSLLLFGGIMFFRYFRKACLGLLGSLVLLGLIAYALSHYLNSSKQQEIQPVKTEDGKVEVFPPKRTDAHDLLNEKKINWWDFFRQAYVLKFITSATANFESQQTHELLVETANASNYVEHFGQIYKGMAQADSPKLDSIINKLRIQARAKKLNSLRTAEMVCTFVQEIPYFLVHDLSCKQAVKQAGSGFTVEYHKENKPCLPNIKAGVQSPYEFMHNLKGDCDTRSLLAFTILRRMGISASIWISEAYGHSVLGVGLPVSTGFYKEINGIRHYAVELTVKGFRLGMISPEQQIQNNWDIALFYNR